MGALSTVSGAIAVVTTGSGGGYSGGRSLGHGFTVLTGAGRTGGGGHSRADGSEV